MLAGATWGSEGQAGACFERLEGTLGDEEELRPQRRRLIDLILSQAL